METINTAEISNIKVIPNWWGSHEIEDEKWNQKYINSYNLFRKPDQLHVSANTEPSSGWTTEPEEMFTVAWVWDQKPYNVMLNNKCNINVQLWE